jgi:hypothetical protein
VVGLAGLVPAQQAFATRPAVLGPIASYRCPPVPMWCSRTVKPGILLTRWRATMRSGSTQNLYKLSWRLGDPHVRLMAAAVNPPNPATGNIPLGSISHWAATSGVSGLLGAINGDFFSEVGYGYSGVGHPSGMLVQSRQVVAFGSGGAGVGYEAGGRMIMGNPTAKPVKLTLPNGKSATIESFDTGSSQVTNVLGDQVIVKTIDGSGSQPQIPGGWSGFIVGSSQSPEPFTTMLRGTDRVSNPTGVDKAEYVGGFRFGDGGGTLVTDSLPISLATYPVTLGPGQALLIAHATAQNPVASIGLTQLATHSHVLRVSVDAKPWSTVQDVMGGKPQLVKSGRVAYPAAHVDPPMMSGDGWQWDYPHWRPALAETSTHGWMIITGGVHYGNGVYGWNWGKMLVQLGARNAMGFDNNSSTELFAPRYGKWSFSPGWERHITEATALTYH